MSLIVRRREKMSQGPLAHHWIAPLVFAPLVFAPLVFAPLVFAPLVFAPFGLMLFVHQSLGLSDALLAVPKPGEPFWPHFNLTMVFVFYLGVGGYAAHAFWLSDRGWAWVAVKGIGLAIAWTTMIVALQASN
ncbi:MAG: hypothetical protein ACRC1K_15065 [Planctomycetia bacterium]